MAKVQCPASPTYINSLIPRLKSDGVKVVMIEAFRPRKAPEYVAKSIGATVLIMPDKVGAHQKVKDYIGLFDYAVEQFVTALKESK